METVSSVPPHTVGRITRRIRMLSGGDRTPVATVRTAPLPILSSASGAEPDDRDSFAPPASVASWFGKYRLPRSITESIPYAPKSYVDREQQSRQSQRMVDQSGTSAEARCCRQYGSLKRPSQTRMGSDERRHRVNSEFFNQQDPKTPWFIGRSIFRGQTTPEGRQTRRVSSNCCGLPGCRHRKKPASTSFRSGVIRMSAVRIDSAADAAEGPG